jgi:hypothetical protein
MTTMFAEQIQQERIVAVKKRILRNLVDEASNEIKETQLEVYRNYGVALNPLTKLPQQQPKIPFWTAMIELFEPNQAVPCMIPVGLCWGDASYNRVDEINWSQINTNIEYSKGYSYDAAAYIDVVYDPNTGRFIVKKGQHRVIMAYLCLGEDAHITANVKLLDESFTEEEQITAEAYEHHVDAQKVARQKAHQAGRSAFVSGDEEDILYTNFILSHGIGVKGKMHLFPQFNHFSRDCDTPWAVKSAMQINTEYTSMALHLLNKYLPTSDKVIGGKAIKSVTQFLTLFADKINKTANENDTTFENFIDEVFKYMWHQRKTKSSSWLKGSQAFRGENVIIPLARLIKFTNSYAQESNIRLPDGRKNEDSVWCSTDEKFWCDFLNNSTPKELHGSVNAIASEC